MAVYPRIIPSGECAVTVEFGNEINEEINGRVTAFTERIKQGKQNNSIPGIQEAVPTFRSVLISYDPSVIRYKEFCQVLESEIKKIKVGKAGEKRIVEIPVCYGGEYGPDLEFVASHAGLSVQEVIDIHTSTPYLIYMLGFQPGFPYLGGLDERLVTPRLSSPRTLIPGGSVGIGGSQTGLYPIPSPAGWQIIGQTPVKCYDPQRVPAIPYAAGDYIHFYAVSEQEFEEIRAQGSAFRFNIHN